MPEEKKLMLEQTRKHISISLSQACKLLGISRNICYYKSKRTAKDTEIKKEIQRVTESYPYKLGLKKVQVIVQRNDSTLGKYQIKRVYRKYGFQLHRKPTKQRLYRSANPLPILTGINQEWAMDFMHDKTSNGTKIRTINIIDQYNRACLAIRVHTSIPSKTLTKLLDELFFIYGKPKRIRTDNGPEFVSNHTQDWLKQRKVTWTPIEPGKPQQNGIAERFNKTYREDVLDANDFQSIAITQHITDQWIDYYNNQRPHEALAQKTPNEYAA